jgi:hypothetical protein
LANIEKMPSKEFHLGVYSNYMISMGYTPKELLFSKKEEILRRKI